MEEISHVGEVLQEEGVVREGTRLQDRDGERGRFHCPTYPWTSSTVVGRGGPVRLTRRDYSCLSWVRGQEEGSDDEMSERVSPLRRDRNVL